ncbi:hypothetical protein MUN84_11605 [Hymenobacter sp. 5516J-16]|uniref:hypothetical protein n=1 Tax=Hymenobacter sp. 5516J-16 TaxID=2932253 RepID=UPI001FD4315A|nr:hypothetical protein [Hymenobacter sp. 5516J-16]UOQ75374.1 hypothetical protein MUN84_11605 [Hymenobacter sp. 5516J-16]
MRLAPKQATKLRLVRGLVARRPPQLRNMYAQAARAGIRLPSKTTSIQKVRRVAAPAHGTEVGLGTTVLGVLGLVVLPLALLGLLIWGGPVWAILAGLAALAVLVAYLDPFA